MTAAVALTAGLPGAYADELSQLRANQQILQQEIDKLQQAQQLAALPGARPTPPGAPSLAGSFPRSFLIPGTDTSIAIGGYIKFDAADYINGGGGAIGNAAGVNPSVMGAPTAAGLPLSLPFQGPFNAHARGHNVFHMSAAESRLRVETRTPTAFGAANTVIEFDFYGCTANSIDCNNLAGGTNPVLPRLRLAYATLGGFHFGQDFVPVNDLQAGPDIFDFGGDAGQFGFPRTAWAGYTFQLPNDQTFLIAAVNPSTGFYGPGGAKSEPNGSLEMDSQGTGLAGDAFALPTGYAVNPAKTTFPDGNFVYRINRPWGALQLDGVIQDLKLEDGSYVDRSYPGYGGAFGLHVEPGWFGWAKDSFGLNGFIGKGLGHYAAPPGATDGTTFVGLATNFGAVGIHCDPITGIGCYGSATGGPTAVTKANAALVRAQTVPQFGAEGNYQHFWGPHLRSTVSAGWQQQDISTVLVGPESSPTEAYNKYIITAHANLIWSPVAFIDTGLEFIYDHRLTIYHRSASGEIVDYAFKVKF